MGSAKMLHNHRLTYWDKLALKTDEELYREYIYVTNPIKNTYKMIQRREAFLDFLAKTNKMHILKGKVYI